MYCTCQLDVEGEGGGWCKGVAPSKGYLNLYFSDHYPPPPVVLLHFRQTSSAPYANIEDIALSRIV